MSSSRIPPDDPHHVHPESHPLLPYDHDIAEVKQGVRDIKKALLGDLSDGNTGLISRVDKTETEIKAMKRVMIGIATTIGGGTVAWLKTFFATGP